MCLTVLAALPDHAFVAADTRYTLRTAASAAFIDTRGRLVPTRAGGFAAFAGSAWSGPTGLLFLQDHGGIPPALEPGLRAALAGRERNPWERDREHVRFVQVGADAAGPWGGAYEPDQPVGPERYSIAVAPPSGLADAGVAVRDRLLAVLRAGDLFDSIRATAAALVEYGRETRTVSDRLQVGGLTRTSDGTRAWWIEGQAVQLAHEPDAALAARMVPAPFFPPFDLAVALRGTWRPAGPTMPAGPMPLEAILHAAVGPVNCTADLDTRSWRVERTDGGGPWVRDGDGNSALVDLTEYDTPSGHEGIGTGETWAVRVTLYSDSVDDRDAGTLTATWDLSVDGPGGGAGAAAWLVVEVSPPAVGASVVSIALQATAATGTVQVSEALDSGSGWTDWTDITASLTPALSTPPTTKTTYTRDCGYSRAAKAAGLPVIRYAVLASIVDGGAVVARQEVETSWYIGQV